MINPKLIEIIFQTASINRWNDYPRMVELVELDKQAHKMFFAYFIAHEEKDVNFNHLIEAFIFDFLRRAVVTDLRPDVFHTILKSKKDELNAWVLEHLSESIEDIEDGEFLKRFKCYLLDDNMYKKERFILSAASYLSTKWEFAIIYQTSKFLNDIDLLKKEVDAELEDYYSLIGVRKIALGKKLASILDLVGRLRFQKRWTQTPRVPETSVLGHMLIVAIFSYFYSRAIKACNKREYNNFFTALLHDLPEALTKDIISPVKYSVDGLNEIIAEYEIKRIEDAILPYIPRDLTKEFSYLLGLYGEKKDEFLNKININKIQVVDTLKSYNEDKFNAIDGVALKACDKLSAFIEASLSISYGIRSKQLVEGKKSILESLKKRPTIEGVNFYKIAKEIEESFLE